MLGTGYFLKIAKINSQQEKPVCFIRKNQFPQNTKNGQSAKINSHINFVPHGISVTPYEHSRSSATQRKEKRASTLITFCFSFIQNQKSCAMLENTFFLCFLLRGKLQCWLHMLVSNFNPGQTQILWSWSNVQTTTPFAVY